MQIDQAFNLRNFHFLKLRKVLNKVFSIVTNQSAIERFKENLIELLDRINDAENQEFHKNQVKDFPVKYSRKQIKPPIKLKKFSHAKE